MQRIKLSDNGMYHVGNPGDININDLSPTLEEGRITKQSL